MNSTEANGKPLLNLDTITDYPTLCNDKVKYENYISLTHNDTVELQQVIKMRNKHYLINEIIEQRPANGYFRNENDRPTFYKVKVNQTTL